MSLPRPSLQVSLFPCSKLHPAYHPFSTEVAATTTHRLLYITIAVISLFTIVTFIAFGLFTWGGEGEEEEDEEGENDPSVDAASKQENHRRRPS